MLIYCSCFCVGLECEGNTLLPFREVLTLFGIFMNKRAEPFCTPTGGAVAIGHLHLNLFRVSIVTLSATRFLGCIRAAVRGQCFWGSCVGAGMVCLTVG